MVRGWGINVWSIPKGKINENEVLMNCAIREVEEETGYTRPTHNHAHARVHILAVLGRTPSPLSRRIGVQLKMCAACCDAIGDGGMHILTRGEAEVWSEVMSTPCDTLCRGVDPRIF